MDDNIFQKYNRLKDQTFTGRYQGLDEDTGQRAIFEVDEDNTDILKVFESLRDFTEHNAKVSMKITLA